jgi:branched-chain amino acid transport system permease protein
VTRGQAIFCFGVRHRTGISVLALAAALVLAPLFLRNPYTLGQLNLIGIRVIAVLGLNLFIGYTGQISLGHAGFFALGAYGSAVLTATYGFPPWPAVVLVSAAVGSLGWLVGVPTLRLRGHYLAMATLGFNVVIHAILVQWDSVTGGPSGFSSVPPLTIGGFGLTGDIRCHYLIWAFGVVALMLSMNLVRSGVGRGLAALAQDEVAAACLGVDVSRGKVRVFVLSAVLASVAGSLYAHYFRFVSPDTFGIFASADLVLMVVVGGMGSVWGTLFGVGFVTLLPEFLGVLQDYKEVFHGLILVGILLLLPEGLLVGVADFARLRAARRRLAGAGS